MGKDYSSFDYISTTGTGIAIGTNVDLGGFIRGSDLAGTITLKVGATTLLVNSATSVLSLVNPIAITGALTMTSSAGDHFIVFYRKRG